MSSPDQWWMDGRTDGHLPTCPFLSIFSRQGSSLPEGVVSEAVSWVRSSSPMSRGMSAAEPTFSWDILMDSSPETKQDTAHTGTDRTDGLVLLGQTGSSVDRLVLLGQTGQVDGFY